MAHQARVVVKLPLKCRCRAAAVSFHHNHKVVEDRALRQDSSMARLRCPEAVVSLPFRYMQAVARCRHKGLQDRHRVSSKLKVVVASLNSQHRTSGPVSKGRHRLLPANSSMLRFLFRAVMRLFMVTASQT